MRLRRPLAALLLLVLLTAPGCWDRQEMEELAFVMALGVDKGEESQYAVTALIGLPSKMAGGGEGGGGGGGGEAGGPAKEKPYIQTTVEAPTVSGALAMIDSYVDRRISLAQLKALFMGEELARESGMHAMDEFVRFREARRTVFYIVTRGRASEFLDRIEIKLEKEPQRFIEQMTYKYRTTGMLPAASQVQDFVTTVNTRYAEPLTYYAAIKEEQEEGEEGKETERAEARFEAGDLPRQGGPNIEMIGAAAFRGEKMVGVLSGDEIRLILLMRDEFQQGYFSIVDPRDPDLFVSVQMGRGRPTRIETDVSGDRPRVRATLTLEGELLAVQSDRDYTQPELQAELERSIAREIEQDIRRLVRRSQEWEADVFGFGEHVVRHFPTVAAWEAYDWPERYRDAAIDVAVRVTLRRFGTQLSPPEEAG